MSKHAFVAALAAAVFVILTGIGTARSQAPDPARLTAARQMMDVAGVAKQFDEVMPLLAGQLSQSFVAIAPDKAKEIREVFSQLPARFMDRKGELIDQIAALYATLLTADELSAIGAFYKSPAGAKFVAVQPQVMRQSIILGQRWGEQIGREIEAEARRELKKRGVDL